MMETEFSCEQCRDLLMEAMDQPLAAVNKRAADSHLEHCESCAEFSQTLWQADAMANRWQDEMVPGWQRRETFFTPLEFWPRLQWVSSLASVFVLVLVLGQARISTADGLQISFGANSQLSQEVFDKALADAEAKQQALLELKVSNLTSQQIAANQLLMRTVLEMSREERRDEYETLLTTWDNVQDRRNQQTNESLRVLLASQVEDKRNIQQINRLLQHASLEGTNL